MTDRVETNGRNLVGRGSGGNGGSAVGGGVPNGREGGVETERLADAVSSIAGVRALAPGLHELVATATAKVLRRAGGEPVGVDVTRDDEGVKVRIDAHFDDTRSVAEVVDEIFAVVVADIAGGAAEDDPQLDIDLRVVSRS